MNGTRSAEPSPDTSARARLLEAAIDIACSEGPHMVTYRAVAARASVSHGLVRHHFGTREAMLAEALELAALREARRGPLTAGCAGDVARGLVESLDGDRLLRFDLVLDAIRGGDGRGAALTVYDHRMREIAATLSGLRIEDPGGHWAALVCAALDGLALQHALYGSPQRAEAIAGRVAELLAHLSPAPEAGAG
ncbi:TetR family transcriptional regulator [Nonomuraea sp. NPDC050643]|uniref:TetR/AcrR family transcriptional regulator n=1 Tax=Nonomuraea sp. NPDC050643 TaxID=3155660 RepID=UPI0033CF6FAE